MNGILDRDVHAAAFREQLLAAYLEKRGDLVRFLAARMGSTSAAEDLVQDLYVRLAVLEVGARIENPSAFLYRTAINLMLDRGRGERRTAARERAWQEDRGVSVAGFAAMDEPSPEEAAAARERLRRLVEAVENLPPKTRRAFKLHKFEGLSQAETAQRLGVTRKTVENQLAAALKALVARMDRYT